jgi:hypothetical protein
MAYTARIHAHDRYQSQMTQNTAHSGDTDILLQGEEAANTWWAIVIYEKYVSSRVLITSSIH